MDMQNFPLVLLTRTGEVVEEKMKMERRVVRGVWYELWMVDPHNGCVVCVIYSRSVGWVMIESQVLIWIYAACTIDLEVVWTVWEDVVCVNSARCWSSVLLQHMLDLPLPICYQIWIRHVFNLLQHMFQLSTQLLLLLAPRSSTCTTESVLLSHISHANALLQQHMPPSPLVQPSFL